MKGRPAETAPRFNPILLIVLLFLFLFMDWVQYRTHVQLIPYSQFLAELNHGNVAAVIIDTEKITGAWKSPKTGQPPDFYTYKIDDPQLVEKLNQAKVEFTGVHQNNFISGFMAWLLFILAFGFLLTYFQKRKQSDSIHTGGGLFRLSKSKAKVHLQTDIKTRFSDVAGVDEAKEELQEVVHFLKDPAKFSKLGGRLPKGILLLGPPGTGKTLLARAIAGEAGVPFFSINGSEFVELFVGLGATRVRDLFKDARNAVPCIIFIDELDALGKARGINSIAGSGNDEKEQTLNQLLAEMDGFDPSSGIMILASTNRPEVLDPALLRPGRFDRQILVDKPDKLGREKILEIHLKNKKISSDVNIPALASITVGFSGADLANLANEAALMATRRSANEVSAVDFTHAVERVVGGLERKSRILSYEEKLRVAYHEMGHAVVSFASGAAEIVHKVSIIPRGIGALGYTMRRPTEDRFLMTRKELEAKLMIALGGRAAEQVFFEDISTGAGDDLDKATDIARAMITQYGMGKDLGLAVFERVTSMALGGPGTVRTSNYSEFTAQKIDSAVQDLLDHAIEKSQNIVKKYEKFIEECVQIILTKETLEEKELQELWSKSTKEMRGEVKSLFS